MGPRKDRIPSCVSNLVREQIALACVNRQAREICPESAADTAANTRIMASLSGFTSHPYRIGKADGRSLGAFYLLSRGAYLFFVSYP